VEPKPREFANLSQPKAANGAVEFTDGLRPIEDSTTMTDTIRKFIRDESGATAIEYGLIAAGISLVIIAAVNGIGSKLNTKFTAINSSLK
jgi:pilus assembly protein Flp/PilA